MMTQSVQTSLVVIHSEVVKMTLDASSERLMLHRYWHLPLAAAQLMGGIDRPPQACFPGSPRHVPPSSLSITAPVHRKSQEVEGVRTLPAGLTPRWSPEVYQAGLIWMKVQFESAQSLP